MYAIISNPSTGCLAFYGGDIVRNSHLKLRPYQVVQVCLYPYFSNSCQSLALTHCPTARSSLQSLRQLVALHQPMATPHQANAPFAYAVLLPFISLNATLFTQSTILQTKHNQLIFINYQQYCLSTIRQHHIFIQGYTASMIIACMNHAQVVTEAIPNYNEDQLLS